MIAFTARADRGSASLVTVRSSSVPLGFQVLHAQQKAVAVLAQAADLRVGLPQPMLQLFCVVGAGALVTPDTVIEDGQLVLGSPARAKRSLGDEEREWIQSSARHYVELARHYLAGDGSTG